MNWDRDFYGQARHVNRWPFSEVVSNLTRLAALNPERPPRVLEIGCGTGNNLRFLGELGWFGVGIDSSAVGVGLASRFLAGLGLPGHVVVASFESLPFAEGSFDIVFDRGALIHATESGLERAIAEISRVLVDGGYFLTFGLRSCRHPAAPDHERSAVATSAGRPMSFLTRCRVDEALSPFADVRVRTRMLYRDDTLLDEEFEALARKGGKLPMLKGWP